MSQSSTEGTYGQPKSFLKKGEGLKRFAAYKPPLPKVNLNISDDKNQRRQTFVKFKLEHMLSKENQDNFKHPNILNDKNINLATEIPKIPPPKILHTPVKPTRQALGGIKPSLLNSQTPYQPPFSARLNSTDTPITPECNKAKTPPTNKREDIDPYVESCIIALGEQIKQIQQKVHELQQEIKKCNCCAPPTSHDAGPKLRRSNRRSAKSNTEKTISSTNQILESIVEEVARLRKGFDDVTSRG